MNYATFADRHLSYAKIRDENGPIGTAFVVGPRRIMTCAHVVRMSLGLKEGLEACPSDETIYFTLEVDEDRILEGRVLPEFWRSETDPSGDIAVVELIEESEIFDSRACRIRAASPVPEGRHFTAFGVKVGFEDGVVVYGKLRGRIREGRYGVISEIKEEAIDQGCSGGAVWTEGLDAIVGMIVEWRHEQSAVIIPSSTLRAVYPELGSIISDSRPAPTVSLNQLLWKNLHMFDRVPQADGFETVLTKTWDEARKPILCLIAGVDDDLPDRCFDRLVTHLATRFAELGYDKKRILSASLSWPTVRAFNVKDQLDTLKNGLKVRLQAGRAEPAALRDAYNRCTMPMVLESKMLHSCFSKQHRELLERWSDFLDEIGLDTLNKPLAHLLILTFAPPTRGSSDERAASDRDHFYQKKVVPRQKPYLYCLPLLGGFTSSEVVRWLDEVSAEFDLDPGLVDDLKYMAHERFRQGTSRIASLDKWVRTVRVGNQI